MTAEKTLIRVGHSPDPDDAFMFHALANDKIETGPYQFVHELVEVLIVTELDVATVVPGEPVLVNMRPGEASRFCLRFTCKPIVMPKRGKTPRRTESRRAKPHDEDVGLGHALTLSATSS